MSKVLMDHVKLLLDTLKTTFQQFKNQFAYELKVTTPCPKTGKHRVEVKIAGKSQRLNYYADEVAADNKFLSGFCPADIRIIVYLATSDKYEAILEEKKIKKKFEMIRSKTINGNKTVQFRDKKTGNHIIKTLKDFDDVNIIESLSSHEAYKLGYLAGQEQSWIVSHRLKLITCDKNDLDPHL